MAIVTTQHSMSLDGFIADSQGRGDRLHAWLRDGESRSRVNPNFAMAPESARFFDEGVSRCGAVISGRRTYDVSDAWGGAGPMPPRPLFVVTHTPPAVVPASDPPYTFVTDGIMAAVEQARIAADGKDVVLMGASMVQQCLLAGLLDEVIISIVPVFLGDGVRLFDPGLNEDLNLAIVDVVDAPGVTHLTYRVGQWSGP